MTSQVRLQIHTRSTSFRDKTIAVIGLGYVGLPLAVEFGKKRPVIGFDIKHARIEELQRGYDRTSEVTEQELSCAKELVFTNDLEALRKAEIFLVTVPTPVDDAKRPDLGPLIRATETVGRVLKCGDVVIYESTVYPGATEEVCVPILERVSGFTFNKDFYVGYSPERINPGDKEHRLPGITKITSGSTAEIARFIDELYKEIIIAGTFLASSIKVAEAAKVIENAQRDLNIAFVNELSLIFNRLDIDTTEVLTASATKWNFLHFKPGLVGGHCIGVDPYYLTYKAQEHGYQPQVILSGRRINDDMGTYAASTIIRLMLKRNINISEATIGVLGITFKENCPDVRNSKVIDLVRELVNWGAKVRITDPWVDAQELFDEHGLVLSCITPDNPVDALVVAVSHHQFSGYTAHELRALCAQQTAPVLADLKAIYKRDDMESVGFQVFRF
jgi:UDP-N-acetyl-D-galactosamine dehydrogenase